MKDRKVRCYQSRSGWQGGGFQTSQCGAVWLTQEEKPICPKCGSNAHVAPAVGRPRKWANQSERVGAYNAEKRDLARLLHHIHERMKKLAAEQQYLFLDPEKVLGATPEETARNILQRMA